MTKLKFLYLNNGNFYNQSEVLYKIDEFTSDGRSTVSIL